MSKSVESPKSRDLLVIRPIPELSHAQITKFTLENLRAKAAGFFDPSLAQTALKDHDGQKVVAVDFGGDKLIASTFQAQKGSLVQDLKSAISAKSSSEADYLSILEDIAKKSSLEGLAIGVSAAGPVEGTKSLASPNLTGFLDKFDKKYDRDFSKLFPTLSVVANDMVACIVAGAVEVKNKFPQVKNILLIGNGSGFGGAVIKGDGQIIAIEPGHVEVIDSLNPYGQDKPCGLFGAKFVCTERVAASKAGVESLWAKIKGENLSGRQISAKYMQGDALAADLYDNSALVIAHSIKGTGEALELFKKPNDTAIVCHGGIFNVNGYGNRVQQILQRDLGYSPILVLTRDFSQNACLEGAALAALTKLG